MAIFRIESDRFHKIGETTFSREGLRERDDLQRLLRNQIEIVSPATLIIGEEFGQWEESRRRIDLLGIDKNANLVVIELKRTEDGGHMELQAIRYAAMISVMTFEKAVEEYQRYIQKYNLGIDAREAILEFLDWEEPIEDEFAQDVRIVLVSAEFSVELTTSVIWLNDHGLDIKCIRIKPYADGDQVLVDVQQIIPLPEAENYQVRLKEKQQRERANRKRELDLTKFDLFVGDESYLRLPKRRLVLTVVTHLCNQGHSPESIANVVSWRKNRMFRSVRGEVGESDFIDEMTAFVDPDDLAFDPRRFFTKDEELIQYDSKTYAMQNGWGSRAVEAVTLLINSFDGCGMRFQASD